MRILRIIFGVPWTPYHALVTEMAAWSLSLGSTIAGLWGYGPYYGLMFAALALTIRWRTWMHFRRQQQPECVGALHRARCACGKISLKATEVAPHRRDIAITSNGNAALVQKEAP